MEFIFEIIFGIIFEGSIELMQSKKIPSWIRIICAVIVTFVFLAITGLIGLLAITMWKDNQLLLATIFIIIDFTIIVGIIIKIKKFRINKEDNKDEK